MISPVGRMRSAERISTISRSRVSDALDAHAVPSAWCSEADGHLLKRVLCPFCRAGSRLRSVT